MAVAMARRYTATQGCSAGRWEHPASARLADLEKACSGIDGEVRQNKRSGFANYGSESHA